MGHWDNMRAARCHSRFWPSQLDSSVIIYESFLCYCCFEPPRHAPVPTACTPFEINQRKHVLFAVWAGFGTDQTKPEPYSQVGFNTKAKTCLVFCFPVS